MLLLQVLDDKFISPCMQEIISNSSEIILLLFDELRFLIIVELDSEFRLLRYLDRTIDWLGKAVALFLTLYCFK